MSPFLRSRREKTGEIVRQHDRHRHQLVGFAARVPEHHALIAGTGQLERSFVTARLHFERLVDAHRDVGRLLVDRHAHAARFGVEADRRPGVADLA